MPFTSFDVVLKFFEEFYKLGGFLHYILPFLVCPEEEFTPVTKDLPGYLIIFSGNGFEEGTSDQSLGLGQ